MLVIGSVFSQIFRSVIGDVNWNPSYIFYGGEPGVWYDPSDRATLFTDSAGTTPVTAAGQTVGLMLDKSQGLVLGSELRGSGAIGLVGTATAATYNTTTGVGTVTRVDASNQSFVQWTGLTSVYTKITISCTSGVAITVRSGTYTGTGIVVVSGQTITFYSLASGGAITITSSSATSGFTVTSIKAALGNHATQATLAQRPMYQIDSTGRPYLSFDGVDDGMVTGTITPNTNKVQVFAGVRKISDASQAVVAETSATIASNAGAFALTAPNSAAANYNFSSKGTTQTDNVVTTYTAPVTSVISGLGDIAGASNLIRVNGSQIGSVLTTQGTGNYLAYPLYIGRRGGTTLPFNGRLYSLIVRFGSNLAENQITSAENWVNSKTGAY